MAKLGREVFGVQSGDDSVAADQAIEKTEAFFNSIGMKTKLSDYGINAREAAEKIRARFAGRKTKLGEHEAIDANVSFDIVSAC